MDSGFSLREPRNDGRIVGWAKERSDVPTICRRTRCKMVGTLRFAHPTGADLLDAQTQSCAGACDTMARRANHFGFSEIVSSPGIKNIPLSFSRKSAA